MKKFAGFSIWIWSLLGLLGLATLILFAGQTEMMARPVSDSYSPSGTKAFRDLLEASGYRTVLDRELRPSIGAQEVALRFTNEPPTMPPGPFDTGNEEDEAAVPRQSPIESQISAHFRRGGSYIELPYEQDFIGDTRENAQPVSLRRPGDERTYLGSFRTSPATDSIGEESRWVPVFTGELQHASQVARVGKGRHLLFSNGIAATNRFLGREDNAAILIESTRAVVPKGRTIRFLEGELNPVQRGFFATIGSWALAGWYQTILLAVVVAWTLGKRLGLPIAEQSRQRGTRELLDGIADTLARKKRTNIALEYAMERNSRRLRNHLRLPASVSMVDLLRPMPDLLRSAFVNCEVLAKSEKVSEEDALKSVQRLENQVSEFIGDRRKAR